MARRRGIDCGLQIRMYWDLEVYRISMIVFCLAIPNTTASQVLRAKTDSVYG